MYVGRLEKLLTMYTPLGMCSVNMQGKVTRASERIGEVFKYSAIEGADIFTLTRFKMPEIIEAARAEKSLFYNNGDNYFRVKCFVLGDGEIDEESGSILMYFINETAFQQTKELYRDNMVCVALLMIDNYDELTSRAGEEGELNVAAEIDRKIRQWGAEIDAAVARYRAHMYEIVFSYKHFLRLKENKFDILDRVKEIETGAEFPVTVSIGVGVCGKTIAESEDYADTALDLALGRGGDQAVVKNINELEFFGGKSQSVEKSSKGKSRVVAHALSVLIRQSDKVFIMGHRNPDMDSFGASMGMNRMAKYMGKEAYIVLGEYNAALEAMAEDAKECADFNIISPERALSLVGPESLLIIVDTHRPMLVESMDLVEKVRRRAIIDHHRMAEDVLSDVALSYIESYASSASELVTEIVQYACDRKALIPTEANGLMAGIMVDTNRFAVKSGVRTFEAASWLRRRGADLGRVRQFFQGDAESFMLKAQCVSEAAFYKDGIVMSIMPGRNINAQILNSQVADELLTVKGVKASFVAGYNDSGRTTVSARSLGEINVQVIMEKFGGGGHLNTAGVQLDEPPEKILEDIRSFLDTFLS